MEIYRNCCMLLRLCWYKFKLDCYNFKILNVIPITTNKISIEYTHKEMRRGLKYFTTKVK